MKNRSGVAISVGQGAPFAQKSVFVPSKVQEFKEINLAIFKFMFCPWTLESL